MYYYNVNPRGKINLLFYVLLVCYSHFSFACLTSEVENNDQESKANDNICSMQKIKGHLSSSDIDWFTFNITNPNTLNISLDHADNDDFDWSLYAATGPAVAVGKTSKIPEIGSYQANKAGQYWLKLTSYQGEGDYELRVDITPSSCEIGSRPSKPKKLISYLTGNANDQCPAQHSSGAVLLMGGGQDVDQAFTTGVSSHTGYGKDILVLRTDKSAGYNDYLYQLLNADSVETLVLDKRAKANSTYSKWVIDSAEFIWIAGGDQSEYLNLWKNTKTQKALQRAIKRGSVIGGTSAGMALLAANIYDPDNRKGAISSEVVEDFCHQSLNFSQNFVNIPVLVNSLTDTHFRERDRMGRSLLFLAHHNQDSFTISADENAAILINHQGQGRVFGENNVYILREKANTKRTQLICGKEVVYENIKRIKLWSGDNYNFKTKEHNGTSLSISIDGWYNDFYTPYNPYID